MLYTLSETGLNNHAVFKLSQLVSESVCLEMISLLGKHNVNR